MSTLTFQSGGVISSATQLQWVEQIGPPTAVVLPINTPVVNNTIFPPTPLFLLSNAGNTLLRM